MNKLKYFLPLGIFLLLGVFLLRGIELDPTELPSPLIDKPFPDFQLQELRSGKALTAADLKGKAVLLNVWATWCVSCKMEHPFLLQLAKEGVVIVGLNYKDDSSQALLWLQNLGDPYVFNISDPQGKLGLDLGVFGAPETFIIDQQGIVRHKHVGVIDQRVWDTLAPIYRQAGG